VTYVDELCLMVSQQEISKTNIQIPSSQTKVTIRTQKTKDKTITWNKETQMTGQHEPL